ncbi:HAD-like domain-containing protein [Lentinula edodes]|uniref:HAD-like domain-containing protein n=1 Tax=Lentinula edodes TaxID=5353 RepID=UPI001E8CB6AB|nr:HAD-like domain-containing protein [Lentinula edodes]KAH7868827.1 HAD-like domain-containing protein [Lentinula edodes]
MSAPPSPNPLHGVEVLLFDVFGTVVDWRSSVTKELENIGKRYFLNDSPQDWLDFANEWRKGYMENTRRIAEGGEGTNDVDIMHREILDTMLSSPRWSHIGEALKEEKARVELNLVWHRLDAWPDTLPGLHALKKHLIIATLSNGNVRLLVDMAKHAGLPWDAVFSSALWGVYKPNPLAYASALHHLSIVPNKEGTTKAAMVAAHLFDLRAAKKAGMRTVYVRRPGEDAGLSDEDRKKLSESGGGNVDGVDVVVSDFKELARLFGDSE